MDGFRVGKWITLGSGSIVFCYQLRKLVMQMLQMLYSPWQTNGVPVYSDDIFYYLHIVIDISY
jgi:hypothetical protein